jgi:hypothetical protein
MKPSKSIDSFLLVLLLAIPLASGGGSRPVGLAAMADIGGLPLLFPNGTQTRQVLSYDPTGGNWDHHFQGAFVKYPEVHRQADGTETTEYVIFDEYGPGCLYRQQMNAWFDRSGIPNGWLPIGELTQPRADANLRCYFDDELQPRVDLHLKDYFGMKQPPFDAPLGYLDSARLFADLYYPFPYQHRLKITMRPNAASFTNMDVKWYQYTGLAYPADFQLKSWVESQEAAATVKQLWARVGENPNDLTGTSRQVTRCRLPAGATKTIWQSRTAGSLVGLKLQLSPYCKEIFFDTTVRIYWDGDATPAVDLPLGYLFGGGGKDYATTAVQVTEMSLTNLMFGFSKPTGGLYTYWPMPFWKSARIELENHSRVELAELTCETWFKPARVRPYASEAAGYFHARRTIDGDPDGLGFRGVAFAETGRGHVVGKVFFSDRYDMDGDEFTYLDDSRTPQIHGSGTEDDHNQGWAGRACQQPLWGGLFNGYNGAYRIYLNDCYIFNRNINITYEYSLTKQERFPKGGSTDVTIFYYKANAGPNLQLTDELDVGNHYSETQHEYRITAQTWQGIRKDDYDGYERNLDFAPCTDDGRSFRGASRFVVRVDPKNEGVRLRKRINRSGNGVQTAEVWVDGVKVARPWHIVTASFDTGPRPAKSGTALQPAMATGRSIDGWFDSDFEIPASLTRGKGRLDIEMKYLAAPLRAEINEFYYWVYSYR